VKYILEANGILLWSLNDLKNYYSTPSFISIFNFINHNVGGTTNLYKFNLAKTFQLNSLNQKVVSKNIEAPSKGVPMPSSSLQVKTWKLEGLGDTTHAEIRKSINIFIGSLRGVNLHDL
jgi:hypothetical protein